MKVVKCFSFESAHYLPNYVGKCKQMHGHSYRLEVAIEGKVNPDTGMVIDFSDLKYRVTKNIIDCLDHKVLNDVIPNPTAENILIWISKKIELPEQTVLSMRLWETSDSYVEL